MTTPSSVTRRPTPHRYTPDVSRAATDLAPPARRDEARWSSRLVLVGYVTVCALALLASWTSLRNGFAYDDVVVIAKNARVHTLHDWWHIFREAYWPPPYSGGLYRPLVILSYALLWKVGSGSPLPFHVAAVVLYAATCAAMYRLARTALSERAAWVAAALFAVHPVHVEAVGNMVGMAEVLCGLALLLAVAIFVEARRANRLGARTLTAIGALYVIAALSKEHGFFLPALLLIAELLLVDDARPMRARVRALLPLGALLGVIGALYLLSRGTIADVAFGARYTAVLTRYPWRVRLFTFFNIVQEWVRLLFWPAQLSIDYSPQRTLVPMQWTMGQLPGVVIIACVSLGGVVLAWVNRRVAFAIGWLGVTLAVPSGLLVATGFILAERTLFAPSVGAALLAGFAAQGLWSWSEREAPETRRVVRGAAAVGFAVLVACGAWRSAQRQSVWRSNDTVFTQIVVDAPLSYRAQYAHGAYLFEKKKQFRDGERHLRMAIRLFDADPEPREYLALQYAANDFCAPAIPLLNEAMELRGRINNELAERYRAPRAALIKCYLQQARYDSAAVIARQSVAIDPRDTTAARLLATADSALLRSGGPVSPRK